MRKHTFNGLTQYIMIPIPDDFKTLRFYIGSAFAIIFNLLCMLTAINFDNSIPFNADKIDKIAPYLVLSAKFKPIKATPTNVIP